jgi:hypothetical protein
MELKELNIIRWDARKRNQRFGSGDFNKKEKMNEILTERS